MKSLLLIPILLSSCVYADGQKVASLGGRVTYNGRDFSMTSDHEKSFSDGAIAATAVAGLYYGAANVAAQEATTRNANNNALKENLGAQKLEQFKVGEDTKKFLHSTPNPNLP